MAEMAHLPGLAVSQSQREEAFSGGSHCEKGRPPQAVEQSSSPGLLGLSCQFLKWPVDGGRERPARSGPSLARGGGWGLWEDVIV